ncbi:uncharacterized protein LOC113553951 [Rhopalosiphum maidis]|uniref:uncharacterized protein LOC113553951 n=1 Tax=Rhopalosiphum maidis TaxID=43146 RepID=UPI000F000C77|nr:uncharacterized protein LOC113553951 [Rhopalosiphum maidis]
MMKRFIFIFWVFFSLSVFQNGCASAGKCVFCKFGLIKTPLNSSVIKSTNDRPKSLHTMTSVSIQNTIFVKTNLDHHTEQDFLTSTKTAEDLVKFSSQTSLANLSHDEKLSIIIVVTSFYGHMTVPLPPVLAINLINMLACSPKLFSSIPQQCLNSILSILAVNQCALCGIPTKDVVPFLNGLLSLSPGVLNSIPKASFISILGMASSTEIFNNVTHTSVMNLITVLSMSKSTIKCLPLPTLFWLMTFVASKPLTELMIILSPSTVYDFLGGLLDTLDDSSPFLINTIPTSVTVAILSPIMTTRMLGVMPIIYFDLLMSVLGSSHAILKALPTTNFISTFNILINSPNILSSLNPNNVAKILSSVATCPSIMDNIPLNYVHQLLEKISVYSPSSLACISENELTLLYREKN